MTSQELTTWLGTILISTLIYLAIVLILTSYYHRYLKSSRERVKAGSIPFLALLLISVAVVMLVLPLIMLPMLFFPTLFAYFVIFFVIAFSIRVSEREFRCLKEEEFIIDDVKFIKCYEGPTNAWYDTRKKKIYISDRLLDIFDKQELKAIYFHEEGHKEHYVLLKVLSITRLLWLFFLASIITIRLLLERELTFLVFLLPPLIPLAVSISLVTMFWCWLNEHEADVYSSEKVGVDPLISALIKVSIYRCLERGEIQWYTARTHIKLILQQYSGLIRDYKQKDIFILLLKKSFYESFKIPGITEVFRKPLPETHPPLGLRICKLLSLSSRP